VARGLAVPDHDRAVGVDAKALACDAARQEAEALNTLGARHCGCSGRESDDRNHGNEPS
jgi:hypothetical protein